MTVVVVVFLYAAFSSAHGLLGRNNFNCGWSHGSLALAARWLVS